MLPTNPPANVPAVILPLAGKLENAAPLIVAPVRSIVPVTVMLVVPTVVACNVVVDDVPFTLNPFS